MIRLGERLIGLLLVFLLLPIFMLGLARVSVDMKRYLRNEFM